jgi:glycosyltransferase involved in cell wall biosynthesis
MILLFITGTLFALLSLPGTVELFMLTVAGLLKPRRLGAAQGRRLRIAAVLPAHNEELNIARCVHSLLRSDRTNLDLAVVVIADNCQDATAVTARAAGARVLVRRNEELRGKGYALDYAFQSLLPEGHDVFLVVDADSEVSANLVPVVAAAFRAGAQATQCRYIVRNVGESIRTRLMNVALFGFNVLRPRGRDRLGLSAGIYGNGFALSAETLRAVPYTASSVVEDLEYHLSLVRAGRVVRFLDSATVFGDMPTEGAGVKTQRTRWEGGRFRMLTEKAPGLLEEVLKGRFRLLEPCLDLLLLPLAFHVCLLLLAAATPFPFPRDLGFFGLAVVLVHLLAAIRIGGGGKEDLFALIAAPVYILWKILLIPRLFRASKSGAAWVRTEREAKEKLP